MAQSPPPQSFLSHDHWIFPQGWGWAGHSDSTSPASSSDSSGSCPCDGAREPSQPAPQARSDLAAEAAPTAPRRARPGPVGGQRQSASEREKLRMRTLARALHELRRFLPPSVAPAGQSLTKIETLRLAIRYIGHLSAVLGLSEETLQRRRRRLSDAAPPQGCPLCPDGGLAQAQGLGSSADAAAPWGSPPACLGALAAPERLETRVPDTNPWVTPSYYPRMQSSPHLSRGRDPESALWMSLQNCPGTQTSPQPGNPAVPWTPPPHLQSWLLCTRVSPCLQRPVCCWGPHLSCPTHRARGSSLRPSGDAGAIVQRCSLALRSRHQAPPSSSVKQALLRAQACSSVTALNFGKTIWRGPPGHLLMVLAAPISAGNEACSVGSPSFAASVVFKLPFSQGSLFQVTANVEAVYEASSAKPPWHSASHSWIPPECSALCRALLELLWIGGCLTTKEAGLGLVGEGGLGALASW